MKRICLAAVLLACAGGCGGAKIVPVSGVVKVDGRPYKGAIVTFQPVGTEGNPNPGRGSVAVTDKEGRFSLRYDNEKPGALVGKHRVRICTQEGAEEIPANVAGESDPTARRKRFVDPIPPEWHDLSTKEFEVPPGGTSSADFSIQSAKVNR